MRNNIIQGDAGSGKTILMKFLFIDAYSKGFKPIFIQLREYSNKEDIIQFITEQINKYHVSMEESQVRHGLEKGGFLLILDSLDEIKKEYQSDLTAKIQILSSSFPRNNYIISSRKEGYLLSDLKDFSCFEISRLTLNQAISLIRRQRNNDEDTNKFVLELNDTLYSDYREFTSNPLLLTVMYLIYLNKKRIPTNIIEFYEDAFETLYSKHDLFEKQEGYMRQYWCSDMTKSLFRKVLCNLCFVAYMENKYEFTKEELLSLIKTIGKKYKIVSIESEPGLLFNDLTDNICLVIRDGDSYRFIHRSFQAYFAAAYVSEYVDDVDQKNFFNKTWHIQNHGQYMDFMGFLYELEDQRFIDNVLYDGMKELLDVLSADNEEFLLKYTHVFLYYNPDYQVNLALPADVHEDSEYFNSIFCITSNAILKINPSYVRRKDFVDIITDSRLLKGQLVELSIFLKDESHRQLLNDLYDVRKIIEFMHKNVITYENRKSTEVLLALQHSNISQL